MNKNKNRKFKPLVRGNLFWNGSGLNTYNSDSPDQILNSSPLTRVNYSAVQMPNNLQSPVADYLSPRTNSAFFTNKFNDFFGVGNTNMSPVQQGVGIAQSALGLGNQIAGNLKVPEIQEANFNSGTKGDLITRAQNFNGYDVGRTSNLGETASGALTGASMGTAILPGIGTAIGGIFGGLAGGISSIFGNKKKKKAEREANQRAINSMNAQNTNINSNMFSQALSSQFKFGGLIGNKFAGGGDTNSSKEEIAKGVGAALNPFFALGGNLNSTHGGNFSNNIEVFNTGGTHEENPYGGIIQGIGENGQPNLVEEGEVKWNDYIFSDRLKTKKDIGEYLLPKSLGNKSFADAALLLQKESKERPVDPISRRGLNANLSKLMSAQETLKEEKENNTFKHGGYMGKKDKLFVGLTSNQGDSFEGLTTTNVNLFAGGGDTKSKRIENFSNALKKQGFTPEQIDTFINIAGGESNYNPQARRSDFDLSKNSGDFGALQFNKDTWGKDYPEFFKNNNWQDLDQQAMLAKQIFDKQGYAPWMGAKGTNQWGRGLSLAERQDPANLNKYRGVGSLANSKSATPTVTPEAKAEQTVVTKAGTPEAKVEATTATTSASGTPPSATPSSSSDVRGSNRDWLRLAPLFTNAYTAFDAMRATPDRLALGRVAPMGLGERMTYNPIDNEYIANQMRQQGANAYRGIIDTSGGNRGIAQAGVLALNRSNQDTIGEALFKGREYNDNKLKQVQSFNRDTEMFNINNDFQAQQYNTNTLNQERMWNKQADASRRNAVRQGIANIGTTLGDIGTENRWMDIAHNTGLGYNSKAEYKQGKEKVLNNGGVLKIYKRRIK